MNANENAEQAPPTMYEECGTVVTTPSEIAKEAGFEWDSRFRHWGRVITGFDPKGEGGYALAGEWFNWGEHMALSDGMWIVLGAEVGSRKCHPYHFALFHREAGQTVRVKVLKALDQYLTEGVITPQERAKAANSLLWAYGLYFDVVTRRKPHP